MEKMHSQNPAGFHVLPTFRHFFYCQPDLFTKHLHKSSGIRKAKFCSNSVGRFGCVYINLARKKGFHISSKRLVVYQTLKDGLLFARRYGMMVV